VPCSTRRESRVGYTEFPRLPQFNLYERMPRGIRNTNATTIKAAWYANTFPAP